MAKPKNQSPYRTDLDRLADVELQHGHHARAEHLARLADDLRAAQ